MSLEYIYLFYITGTGDIIAVMITELRGKDILSYLEKNISVQMTIAVGTRMPPKNFSRPVQGPGSDPRSGSQIPHAELRVPVPQL